MEIQEKEKIEEGMNILPIEDILICQGAEGKVYKTMFLNKPTICKERLKKSYRVNELDEKINKQRILQEARCIAKCRRNGVSVPSIYYVDLPQNRLYMEYIDGETLKSVLWNRSSASYEEFLPLVAQLGIMLAAMHDSEVIHGDLTTSNIIFSTNATSSSTSSSSNNKVTIIDFGLGAMKPTPEDKAVDLYVLERAFISTHPDSDVLISKILESYRFASKTGTLVLLKLDQVRQRGRKRDMIG